MIYVIGPKDPRQSGVINTTSRSKNWSKGLSPFFLGPVTLSDGQVSKNVENAWQFTKAYSEHLNEDSFPSPNYFSWSKGGFADSRAHRYPMGKGRIPEYSWWDNKKLSYIEARKQIYIPLYSQAVSQSEAFQKLSDVHAGSEDIWLWDFDGYNHRALSMSWDDVIHCETRKMGHAFVLAMMLEGVAWVADSWMVGIGV